MSTRTFYRGPDALVTSEVFVWRTAPPRTFAIRELRNVQIIQGAVTGRPGAPRAAAGSAVLAVTVWPVADTPAIAAVVFLVLALPTAVALMVHSRRSRFWELHGTYRNNDVLLYASTEGRVFNQVARALQRSMEAAHPHSRWDGSTAA